MQKKLWHILSLVAAVACSCLIACKEQTPVSPMPIVRLDQALAQYQHLDSAQQQLLCDSLRPELDAFFAVLDRPKPTRQEILWWSEGETVTVFQPDVDSIYPNLNKLEDSLGRILYNANKDSLNIPELRYTAVVWGRPQPIVRIDSIMLIALNHYLGEDYPGYSHWETYRRYSKSPWALPYDLATAIVATQYPFNMSEPPTLLNWMLYEGALVEAKMRIVPQAQLHQVLGYRQDQLQLAEDNFKTMWNELASRRLIYDTDPMTIDRMLTSAPSSPLLGGTAPGRIGRYIGYMIVRSYLTKHPTTTLEQLLLPSFYANSQSLINSGINTQ